MQSKKERASWWLANGFYLLPCQPNKKDLVPSFGIYRSKIDNIAGAEMWFNSRANIAVMADENNFILDFDNIDVYSEWVQKNKSAAQSYTEQTPRGGTHVFMRGNVPDGVKLIAGVELKKVVLVSPSIVNGKEYKQDDENKKILAVDPVDCLSSLSLPGFPTPYLLKTNQTRTQKPVNSFSHVEKIKQHWTISHVLKIYKPNAVISGRGSFKQTNCPFHGDDRPSFWLNDDKGLWGCHGCKIRGDVINLYARFEGVTVIEAIRRMAAVMS